jgi:hypothetical protein
MGYDSHHPAANASHVRTQTQAENLAIAGVFLQFRWPWQTSVGQFPKSFGS